MIVVTWQYVCVLLGFDFIVIDGDFPEKSVTVVEEILNTDLYVYMHI